MGSSPNSYIANRRPTPTDGVTLGWPLGFMWTVEASDAFPNGEEYVLVSKKQNIALWKRLGSAESDSYTTLNYIVLDTAGAGTYTPSANLVQAYVECIGGGGSASSQATYFASEPGPLYWYVNVPGGGGGYTAKMYTATEIGTSQPYVIGAGGIAPSSGDTAGVDGNDTTFKGMIAGKGFGGLERSVTPVNYANGGGIGGSASGGDINMSGENGSAVFNAWPSGTLLGIQADGYSGATFYGASKFSTKTTTPSPSPVGLNGENGSGGGGVVLITSNASAQIIGGNGGDGLIIITEYIATPSITPVPPVSNSGLVFLDSVSTKNSPVASLVLSGSYFSTYDSFSINLENITPDAGGSMQLNMYASIDGGITFLPLSGGGLALFKSDSTFTYLSNSGTGGQPVIGNLNSTLTGGGSAQVYLSLGGNLPITDRLAHFSGTTMGSLPTETGFGSFGGIFLNGNDQINYIKFVWENSSRNILDGTISIYGYSKS